VLVLFGRQYLIRGIVGNNTVLHQMSEKRPESGQLPGHRRLIVPFFVKNTQIFSNIQRRYARQGHLPAGALAIGTGINDREKLI
jgi:hypothetical protein